MLEASGGFFLSPSLPPCSSVILCSLTPLPNPTGKLSTPVHAGNSAPPGGLSPIHTIERLQRVKDGAGQYVHAPQCVLMLCVCYAFGFRVHPCRVRSLIYVTQR